MGNKELEHYVQSQRERGVDEQAIRQALLDIGWPQKDVDDTMSVGAPIPSSTVQVENHHTDETAQETFVTEPEDVNAFNPFATDPNTAFDPTAEKPLSQPIDLFKTVGDEKEKTPFSLTSGGSGLAVVAQPSEEEIAERTEAGKKAKKKKGMTTTILGLKAPTLEIKEGLTRKAKVLFVTSVAFSFLVFGALGVYGYMKIFQSPERIERNVLSNLINNRSGQFSATIKPVFTTGSTFDRSFGLDSYDTISFLINGAFDFFDEDQSKIQADMQMQTATGATKSVPWELGVRGIEDSNYFRIQTEQSVPALSKSGLSGQWIDLSNQDQASLGIFQLFGTNETQLFADLPLAERVNIRNILQENQVVVFGERVSTELIRDVKTSRYHFTIDGDALYTVVSEIAVIIHKQKADTAVTELLLSPLLSRQDIEGEMWVGQRDYQVYQMEFEFPLTGVSKNVDKLEVHMEFWDHNDRIGITAPEDVITLQELQDTLLTIPSQDENPEETPEENSAENSVEETPTTEVPKDELDTDGDGVTDIAEKISGTDPNMADTDEDGLTDSEEQEYGTNPLKADSDGDGFSDGEEVKNGYNPIGTGKIYDEGYEQRDRERIGHIKAIQTAVELFYAENAQYPEVENSWDDLNILLQPYMSSLPSDPDHPERIYTYVVNGERNSYYIIGQLEDYTHLELQKDIDSIDDGEYSSVNSLDVVEKNVAANTMSCEDATGGYCLHGQKDGQK